MLRLLAVLLFLAAAFGGFVAWVTHSALCLDGDHPMCPDGNATATMTLQLGVGLVGVGVAVHGWDRSMRLW